MRPPFRTSRQSTRTRFHPLAVTSLVVAVLGIPLFGLLTGPLAAILAGIALGQIAGTRRLRGQGLATAAVILGIADMVLWLGLLAVLIPRINMPYAPPLKQVVCPSLHAPEGGSAPIRRAMDANVFLVIGKPRRWRILRAESYIGSGVILQRDSLGCVILTNRHVVDPYFVTDDSGSSIRPASIRVHFPDASSTYGRIWWVDPSGADMALVVTGQVPTQFESSLNDTIHDVQIGEKVFAIGNPHELAWSYAEGVISGTRELPQGVQSLKVLQLQVPINQGNSGGGVYTMDGTLIGMVSWTKHKAHAEGIGFAIRYQDFVSHFRASSPGKHQ